MILEKLTSAIKNDIVSGLRGYHTNLSISDEQLEDEIIDTRLQIINELKQQGVLPFQDLVTSINCIKVDCKSLEKCSCSSIKATPSLHFEIPQFTDLTFIGTIDKQVQFTFYTNPQLLGYHKLRRMGKNNPYIYIDVTPNEKGMCDCYIFNGHLMKELTVQGIFKDPRQLSNYACCSDFSDDNLSYINQMIKDRITKQKIIYYRQNATSIKPNTQTYE